MKALGRALAGVLVGALSYTALGADAAHAQAGCVRSAVPFPAEEAPYVVRLGQGAGALLMERLAGQPVAGEVVALIGRDWVWVVILRGPYACPMPPLPRHVYDEVWRPIMGVRG